MNLTTTHASLAVEPWGQLPGGVVVGDCGNCVDAEPQPIILLRDRDEVSQLVTALWTALAQSERRGVRS